MTGDCCANDTIVTTVMSNLGLYKALDTLRAFGYEKTAVGDKYVYENMLAKTGHCLGGEAVRTHYFQQTCHDRRRYSDLL